MFLAHAFSKFPLLFVFKQEETTSGTRSYLSWTECRHHHLSY